MCKVRWVRPGPRENQVVRGYPGTTVHLVLKVRSVCPVCLESRDTEESRVSPDLQAPPVWTVWMELTELTVSPVLTAAMAPKERWDLRVNLDRTVLMVLTELTEPRDKRESQEPKGPPEV